MSVFGLLDELESVAFVRKIKHFLVIKTRGTLVAVIEYDELLYYQEQISSVFMSPGRPIFDSDFPENAELRSGGLGLCFSLR